MLIALSILESVALPKNRGLILTLRGGRKIETVNTH